MRQDRWALLQFKELRTYFISRSSWETKPAGKASFRIMKGNKMLKSIKYHHPDLSKYATYLVLCDFQCQFSDIDKPWHSVNKEMVVEAAWTLGPNAWQMSARTGWEGNKRSCFERNQSRFKWAPNNLRGGVENDVKMSGESGGSNGELKEWMFISLCSRLLFLDWPRRGINGRKDA